MGTITFRSNQANAYTLVPNSFIDNEMRDANGDHVKIYLYLLRCAGNGSRSLSLSSMADQFDCTEKDVTRALRHWQSKGLVSLTERGTEILEIQLVSEQASERVETTPAPAEATAQQPTRIARDGIPKLEEHRMREILIMAETYLKTTLTPNQIMTLYGFHDTLGFSADLIEYLIEYCMELNKGSLPYMEKVALSWAEKGVRTVSEAKKLAAGNGKEYFEILRAFGIRDRHPTKSETKYMDKWLRQYRVPMALILEACDRTMRKPNQSAPFVYADKIISNWHGRGLRTLREVQELDEQHRREQQERYAAVRQTAAARAPKATDNGNRFNDFDQRTTDLDELEAQLSGLPLP